MKEWIKNILFPARKIMIAYIYADTIEKVSDFEIKIKKKYGKKYTIKTVYDLDGQIHRKNFNLILLALFNDRIDTILLDSSGKKAGLGSIGTLCRRTGKKFIIEK